MNKKISNLFIFIGLVSCVMLAGVLAVAQKAAAQIAPSAAEMVEQLKAKPAAPRTRGIRNLSVEAVTTSAETPATGSDAAAAAADPAVPLPRPSLSLLIQFDFNSAKVKPESQQALANLAQALQSNELLASKFAVEGHTDAKGRADYNLKLSRQRADAVRAFLAGNGVADARLAAVGKGSDEPANAADPLAAENRRVRIVNLN